MSFDDLIKKGQSSEAAPRFELIEGSFGCDYCWEICDQAEYYKADKRLIYKHDDHVTIVEGFNIG